MLVQPFRMVGFKKNSENLLFLLPAYTLVPYTAPDPCPSLPLSTSCPSWPLSSSCSCSSFLDCRTEDFSQVRQSPAAGDQILSWEEARQDWIVGNQMVVSTQKLSRVRDPRIICVYKKYSAPRQVFIGLSSSLYQIFGLLFFKHFKLLL